MTGMGHVGMLCISLVQGSQSVVHELLSGAHQKMILLLLQVNVRSVDGAR